MCSSDLVDYYRQSKEMTSLLAEDDQLARVVCSARQEILRDLDKAWQRWRKLRTGRPRFKRRTDTCRIYLSTPKHWRIEGKFLVFSGLASSVGPLRIELDREFPKDAKFSSCSIMRDVDEWYAAFPIVFSQPMQPAPHRSVGINRGAIHAIADSNGRVVDSPGFYERALAQIRKRSQDLARKKPGSRNSIKAQARLAKAHQRVRRQRAHWLHEQSAFYARGYDLVAIEDMSVKEIVSPEEIDRIECKRDECIEAVHKDGLCRKHFDEIRFIPRHQVNRNILDVGWYELGRQLEYKMPVHGGELRKVDPGQFASEALVVEEHRPKGISSACSVCGKPLKKPATGRAKMRCDGCENKGLGDSNAAKNVLTRALSTESPVPRTPTASIKIKGRQKRSETPANRAGEAYGGDRQ